MAWERGVLGQFHLSGRAYAQLKLPCSGTGCFGDNEQPVLGGIQLRPDNLEQGCRRQDPRVWYEEGLGVNK